MEEMNIEFGKMVHNARLEQGFTQEYIAEVLNTCCISIRKIEQGKSSSNAELCFSLCKLLNISTYELRKKYVSPYLHKRVKDSGIDIMLESSDE